MSLALITTLTTNTTMSLLEKSEITFILLKELKILVITMVKVDMISFKLVSDLNICNPADNFDPLFEAVIFGF